MLSLVRKVKPCENMKDLDLDAEGICLNKCRSTVKLSLPQHNDTCWNEEKALLGHSVNISSISLITVVMCWHMLRADIQMHPAVSHHASNFEFGSTE